MNLALQFLTPANKEGNWTDLLATLIASDSQPFLSLFGLDAGEDVRVRREVAVPWQDIKGKTRTDRLDLLVETAAEGRPLIVLEAKVLAPIGPDQLQRYLRTFPRASEYRLLQLSNFRIDPGLDPWRSLTWEDLLAAFTSSRSPWVAATARAWLDQISQLVPQVNGGTIWSDVREFAEGDIDIRARSAWLHAEMTKWSDFDTDLIASGVGRSWVVSMEAQTADPHHTVYIELEEGLPVRQWNTSGHDNRPRAERLQGPTVLVGLTKYSDTVNDFDWPLLVRLFRGHVFDANGEPLGGRRWRQTTAQASGRPGWAESVRDADGVPSWLGHGYDMTKDGWRCFGARFGLAPNSTLAEIDAELRRLQEIVRSMAGAIATDAP